MKKLPKTGFWLISALPALLLVSCSQTPRQYKSSLQPLPVFAPEARGMEFFSQPTNPQGGLLLNRLPQLTEEQKDQKTRQNSLRPIEYGIGAAGGINMKTTYQEAQRILNFKFLTSGNVSLYKEEIAVIWRDDPPRVPGVIFLGTGYQGTLDFGPPKGIQKLGSSFADQFTTGIRDATKDPRAKAFILSTYQYMEKTKEDCLQTRKCFIQISPSGNSISFKLPRMFLSFGNDERKNLTQVILLDDSYEPGCFDKPFDFLTTTFLCDSSQTISLGESYGQVMDKTTVSRDLPIIYESSHLIQRTRSTSLHWKRTHLEEDKNPVPEAAPLSGVSMGVNYTAPFLVGGRLVQLDIKGREVSLSLKEYPPPSSQEGSPPPSQDPAASPPPLYLSTALPSLAGKRVLQKNFVKAFLNLLEEQYLLLHQPQARGAFKVFKKVYGEHSDKHAIRFTGHLIVQLPPERGGSFVELVVDLNGASGRMGVSSFLIYNDFTQHILKNQKSFDFSRPVKEVHGFRLGDRIYLRNKDMGSRTALVVYETKENTLLKALMGYDSEVEHSVVYKTGRSRSVTYQKSESVSVDFMDFGILPTFQHRDIEGQSFEEYEIINLYTQLFFFELQNLCSLKGLNLQMGMYDREFEKNLVQEVAHYRKAYTSQIPFEMDVCPYISPEDSLSSSLKRVYFFPSHFLVLGFANRELFSFKIYQKPGTAGPPTPSSEESQGQK